MKLLKQIVALTLVALFLEVGVFNFSAMKMRLSSNPMKNESYTLADCTQVNWMQEGDELISQPDPQLILETPHGKIEEIVLSYEAEGNLPYIDLFYTDTVTTAFSGDAMLRVEGSALASDSIRLNRDVTALRIDLGDEPGLRLKDFRLVVNPAVIDLSMARIVTVFLLFFAGKFLFSLQKTPDYHLEEVVPDSPGEDAS